MRYFTFEYAKILAEYSTKPGEWDALVKLSARPWFERVVDFAGNHPNTKSIDGMCW